LDDLGLGQQAIEDRRCGRSGREIKRPHSA
jgi:hypothetical protein